MRSRRLRDGEILYFNPSPRPARTGALCYPFGDVYFPRIDHACYRERPDPARDAKIEHAHAVYHVVLATGGRGSFLVNGQAFPLRKGLLLLVSPGERHTFNNQFGETKEYCVVTFSWLDEGGRALELGFGDMLSRWLGLPGGVPPAVRAPAALEAFLRAETKHLVEAGLRGGLAAELETLQCLWRILCELGFHFFGAEPAGGRESPLARAKRRIERQYWKPLSLPALAAEVSLTPNYLSSAFRRAFGMTPVKYQNVLRVRAARALMASSGYPLKTIAARVGFEDIYYFSKVFKKIAGESPGACRDRLLARLPAR